MFPIKIDFCCVALHEDRIPMWNHNKKSFLPLGLTVYEFLSGSGKYNLHYNLIDTHPKNLCLSEKKFFNIKRYWYPLQVHKEIIKAAIKEKAETLLILEDDAFLENDFEEKLSDSSDFIRRYDWDIFFLGLILSKNNYIDIKNLKYVKRITKCRGLQGVIIKKRLFNFLLECPNVMCMDELIGDILCEKCEVYGIFPSIISQDDNQSLVTGNIVQRDYFRDLR